MPSVKCPQCATIVTYAAGFDPICPSCGFAGSVPRVAPAAAPLAPIPSPAPAAQARPNQALAIVALILNVVVIPGLGTLIGGRTNEGLGQLALLIVGFVLIFTIILIPVSILCFIAAWIWGIVSGIQLVTAASQPAAASPAR